MRTPHKQDDLYWPTIIKAIRQARNWSQSAFAYAVGSSQETISRWESGSVTPSIQKQRQIERLAETSNISSLGGICHIVRLSPYPMLLCDSKDRIIAASLSSGFREGETVISQTPEFQQPFFRQFSKELKVTGFWSSSGQTRNYCYSHSEFGDFQAVLVSVRVHGGVYCVVQAIPSHAIQSSRFTQEQ